MITPVNARVRISLLPGDLGCINRAGQIRAAQGSRMWLHPTAADPCSCSFPQLQRGSCLSQTERDRGKRVPSTPRLLLRREQVLGATHMYFHNPNFFCSACSHISINKQALTLPVDALNALLHSKHGNELVTWKVLSLTWAVHVQRGKKSPVSQIQ